MLTAPRMYFAMARDGVFFKRLAIVHPTLGTPAFAIIAIAIWAAVLASTGTFEQLLTYVVFTGWIFYGLGALSVFVYRRREPNAPRPFRVPGYPLTPVLFVASAAALVLNTLITQPMRAAAGVIAVLVGTPAFFAWRARLASPSAFSSNRTGAVMMDRRFRDSMILAVAVCARGSVSARRRAARAQAPSPAADGAYDVIIVNGRVVDGSGNAWFYGDVALRGDRIVRVVRARAARRRARGEAHRCDGDGRRARVHRHPGAVRRSASCAATDATSAS